MTVHQRFQDFESLELGDELPVRVRGMLWRGECMDAFSRAEFAVSRTLQLMLERKRDRRLTVPPPAGARYKALSDAISEGGLFSQEGSIALPMLKRCMELANSRAWIAHGVFSVESKSYGWRLKAKFSRFSDGKFVPEPQSVSSTDATEILREISHAVDRLCCQLGQVNLALQPT
jgi:hypothetical protein